MSATGSTAGRPCIGSTRRASIGSRSSAAPTAARYHAVADEGVPFKAIADVIGRRLSVPVVSKSPEEAAEHFGWFAHVRRRRRPDLERADAGALGWPPQQPGLIADLDHPAYFAQ